MLDVPHFNNTKFEIGVSCHDQFCVEALGLTVEQCQRVRAFVTNTYTPSVAYQAREGCGPFLQGYEESHGWVLVEFWIDDPDRMENYVRLLNEWVFGDAGKV